MTRRRPPRRGQRGDDVHGALAALDAPALRTLLAETIRELDERAYTRAVRRLVERAARAPAGWAPAPVETEDVSEVLAFAKRAGLRGYADPADVDDFLGRASSAFLRRDYEAAHRILGALLQPIGEAEIDLGQRELADEVLGTDLDACGAQYAVAAYMLSAPAARPQAVLDAVREAEVVSYFHRPLAGMEGQAVEPLPDLEAFLPAWRSLLEREVVRERTRGWSGDRRGWLREAVERERGATGLAELARASGSAEDYRGWCRALLTAGDLQGAMLAFEEAAEATTDAWARASFLDGTARCAHRLGRRDVPARLERAWRAGPDLTRLSRWLGTAGTRQTLRKRIRAAREACPRKHAKQHAVLAVLAGDLAVAAKLLASAPGLGWSGPEHPGRDVFLLFQELLGGSIHEPVTSRFPDGAAILSRRIDDLDAGLEVLDDQAEPDEDSAPPLPAPSPSELLARAGVPSAADPATRRTLVGALRKAAERRVDGVVEGKRRRYYEAAASLVAAVVACDPSAATRRWAENLRETYRRYPALQRAFERSSPRLR